MYNPYAPPKGDELPRNEAPQELHPAAEAVYQQLTRLGFARADQQLRPFLDSGMIDEKDGIVIRVESDQHHAMRAGRQEVSIGMTRITALEKDDNEGVYRCEYEHFHMLDLVVRQQNDYTIADHDWEELEYAIKSRRTRNEDDEKYNLRRTFESPLCLKSQRLKSHKEIREKLRKLMPSMGIVGTLGFLYGTNPPPIVNSALPLHILHIDDRYSWIVFSTATAIIGMVAGALGSHFGQKAVVSARKSLQKSQKS